LSDEILSLPHLRALIGIRVRYLGRIWVVIEVLETPASLVLEREGEGLVMQADVHGRPWDYGAETLSIPVLTLDRTGLSDELLALELLET
jgi:hypothetical protein